MLRLPDLDHTKLSVLNTLGSPQSQRAYRIAIDDFIAWYCSEPRIAFNMTVVLRYHIRLEAKHLASATINLRLAAVRGLAYEAADVGLLRPGSGRGHCVSKAPSVWRASWELAQSRAIERLTPVLKQRGAEWRT